jgi:hypothetical protein
MHDETESARREMIAAGQPTKDLAQCADQIWDTEQLSAEFTVLAFLAPFAIVRRKRDGKCGSVEFIHSPRRYFNWQPDDQQGA